MISFKAGQYAQILVIVLTHPRNSLPFIIPFFLHVGTQNFYAVASVLKMQKVLA
jgi:hypothetical protein